MKNVSKKLLSLLLALLGMLLIISFAVTLTLNARWLYISVMEKEELVSYTGLEREVILENYDVLIKYNSLFYSGELDFPDFPMSEGGKIHFVEVKNIFVALQIAGCVSFAALLAYAIFEAVKKRRDELCVLRNTGIITVALPSVVAAFVAIDWDSAFVIFHKIFFRNDLWLFDYDTDPIIWILPDEYFLACAVMIICIAAFLSSVCLASHFLWVKKKRAKA